MAFLTPCLPYSRSPPSGVFVAPQAFVAVGELEPPTGCRWPSPNSCQTLEVASARLAKTDAIDAAILADFAETLRPPVRPVPDAEAQKLQALLTRRTQLIHMRTMEKNRLAALTNSRVRRSVQNVIRTLEREVRQADKDLGEAIRACPVWAAKDELLQSIPGIGPTVSRTLLAEMPELR